MVISANLYPNRKKSTLKILHRLFHPLPMRQSGYDADHPVFGEGGNETADTDELAVVMPFPSNPDLEPLREAGLLTDTFAKEVFGHLSPPRREYAAKEEESEAIFLARIWGALE